MYNYRMATLTDLPAMASIENAAGFNHWNAAQLQDSIQKHQVFLIEFVSGLLLVLSGFAIFNPVLDETELLNIVIAPQQQGKGMGKALLLHGLQVLQQQDIRQCFLEVGVSNNTAIHLYQKCGFNKIGLRKNYYQHANSTEDALVMQLLLKEIPCKN